MFLKIPASGMEPARILFYYNRDTLFNDVSLMSNFMAKNLKTKDGDSLTDDYAISDDEKDLFNVCVRATLPDIYEAMVKITNAVTTAFSDDVTEAGASGRPAAGHYVEFTLLDNAAYNNNVLTVVDASLNNTIKQGVLKEFYTTVLQPDYFKVCTERFAAELFKLKQRLFQLKKKTVVSNLT